MVYDKAPFFTLDLAFLTKQCTIVLQTSVTTIQWHRTLSLRLVIIPWLSDQKQFHLPQPVSYSMESSREGSGDKASMFRCLKATEIPALEQPYTSHYRTSTFKKTISTTLCANHTELMCTDNMIRLSNEFSRSYHLGLNCLNDRLFIMIFHTSCLTFQIACREDLAE